MSDRRGFALLAVMLVLALLGVVVTELAFSMRLEAAMVRSYKEGLMAQHLAAAGVEQAIRELLTNTQIQWLDPDGQLLFYQLPGGQTVPVALPAFNRTRVSLGGGEFSYRLLDEEGRLNVNTAPPDRVERLLAAMGIERQVRDTINDSLQDWKDANDDHRMNGAESDDHYLKLPVPYRARNANLQDTAELQQIKGVTPEIYWGRGDRPGLVDLVTVHSRTTVNLNTASPAVLKALNLSDAEITDIVQSRQRAPYANVPGRFAGRGLAVGSQTFRIEAEGLVGGQPKARVVAVIQKQQAATAGRSRVRRSTVPQTPAVAATGPSLGLTVLSWRSGADG
jgi:general secretion pathway protein K